MKKETLLKAIPPCKEPREESEKVQAVCQVAAVDGKNYLNIDLFYQGRLKARYFADVEKEEHIAKVDGKWRECTMENVARLCMGMDVERCSYSYLLAKWHWATEEDEKIAKDYLKGDIRFFEREINSTKTENAYKRRIKRIDEEMDKIPCIPDEVEGWVRQELFDQEYMFFKKNKTRTEYSCTVCGRSSWRKKSWKHGEKTICPKCGENLRAWSRTMEKKERKPVIILQANGQKWVERQFYAVCRWKAGEKKNIELNEEIRVVIKKGATWGKIYYGIKKDADEFAQDWWDKNNFSKRFVPSYLYPGNLSQVLEYGNLQKSGLDIIAERKCKLNINRFITSFHDMPYIEYLIKAGYTALTTDIVEGHSGGYWISRSICSDAGNINGTLKLDGNRTKRLKQINGGLNTLEWLQYEKESEAAGEKIKISEESLKYLNAKRVSKWDCKSILEELGSVNRMVNYMKKQRISPNSVARIWADYLSMAREEGLDTADDIVRMPRDLKARHDQMVEIRNARLDWERIEQNKEKYKKIDKRIQEHIDDAMRYSWEDDTYLIIPATKCIELVEEGKTLHHCVGSNENYMESMANGITWILFLRKKENPQKAYYTIEIELRTDKIRQWYSEFDRKPNQKEISKVLNKFTKQIKRKQKIMYEIA